MGFAAAYAQAGHAALQAAGFQGGISVTMILAPDAPTGWPRAQAPRSRSAVVRDLQIMHGSHCHHRKCLVYFKQVYVIYRPAGFFQHFFYRPYRAVVNQPVSWACVDERAGQPAALHRARLRHSP